MSISVNSILDAGLIAHGKMPDIYWELNLTGSEIKVLKYVYDNCIRLYKNLKFFPRGKDGSPRYWRGKERMAEDCGISYTGFRNTVNHLYELGLVTSMKGEDCEDEPYCIGLSSKFLDDYMGKNKTVKNLRFHNLKDLISLIYNKLTIDLAFKNINIDKLPLITNVIKLTETQEFESFTGTQKSDYEYHTQEKIKITRKPITVGRTSIMVGRTPIITVPKVIRLQSAKQKLKSLQNIKTPYEKKLLEIAEYYEFKCRQVLHSTGFRCLGKDFRNHKNWVFLERIHKLCSENDWDYRIYIDAQFDRVKYWKRKQLYPYLNQFNSDNAINYYKKYVKDYQEQHSITGDIKPKAQKIKSVNQQIIDDVIKDCDNIMRYIESAKKRRNNKGLTEQEIKMLYLSDHWTGLSTSYLASIPWFLKYLEMLPEETFMVDLKDEIKAIRSSKKVFEITTNIVNQVEKQMGVPETICL